MHVPNSNTLGAAEENVHRVIDGIGVNNRNGVLTTILFSLCMFLFGCQSIPERFGEFAVIIALYANALMRHGSVPLVGQADAATTLKDEKGLADLCDQMVSTASWAEASFVVRVGAALAKDQRAFDCIIAFIVTSVTLLPVPFPKCVRVGDFGKVFLCSDGLWADLFFFVT